MPAADRRPMNSVQTYQELAVAHDQQGQVQVRDRFLVLAADAALLAGRAEEAESLRARLLQLNPHHLLKPFASLGQALESPDVKTYVEGLRRTYPPEEAEQALQKLKKEPARATGEGSGAVPTLPRTGPSSPEWEEAKRQPARASTPVARPAVAPPPMARPAPSSPVARPAPAPPPPASPPPARAPVAAAPPSAPPPPEPPPPPVVEAPIPFAAEPAPPPRNTRVYPVVQPAVEAAHEPLDEERDDSSGTPGTGGWLASALFYLVLLSALALGAYTLVRPFL